MAAHELKQFLTKYISTAEKALRFVELNFRGVLKNIFVGS
jgi:hypothetical protein